MKPLQNENVAFPFTRYTPIHPGAEIGVGVYEVEKDKSIQTVNVYAGGFYHKRLELGLYVRGEYQYTLKFKDKVGLDLPVGIGYLHSFYPGELYELNSNGEFETVSQTGRPHALITGGVGVRYLGFEKVQPFVRQSIGIETPFANYLPVLPHSFLSFGVTIQLN